MNILVVVDGSLRPELLKFISSRFEVELVRDAYQASQALLNKRGFDLVISYAHKRQKDATQLRKIIDKEFPQQQLPIVCSKCISAAAKRVDELEGMSAGDLIHQWLSNTKSKECQINWTQERNSNFFTVVESLGDNATASQVLSGMVMNKPGLTLTREQVNSHLQKYRDFKRKSGWPLRRKGKLARHEEEYLKDMVEAMAVQMPVVATDNSDYYPSHQNRDTPMFVEQNYSGGNHMVEGSSSCPVKDNSGGNYQENFTNNIVDDQLNFDQWPPFTQFDGDINDILESCLASPDELRWPEI